ncbi:hypothetical protein SAMN05892883_2253 [Jatrophihabitans sp. GAS493]|nr:hypothetical protein [Jatrophihabitans sp. GAS493]SOD72941.1 hypothetical protein SAMN05892883_2253 [Jatrophihabitans sp. GAS493]
MAVVAVAMVAMLGMVVDGGNALAARERAADVAAQAARAGVDALTPISLRSFSDGSALATDPTDAQNAADQVLAAGGATGTVTVSGATVTVRATIQKKTDVLSAFGVTDIRQSASANATAVFGAVTAGGS